MSEVPKWMPGSEELLDVMFECGVRGAVDLDPLRAKVITAVEKALAERAEAERDRLKGELEDAERAIRAAFLLLNAVARESETFDTLPAVLRARERAGCG